MEITFKGLALLPQYMTTKDVENQTWAPTFVKGDKNTLSSSGYSVVGTATLTVTLHDAKEIHAGRIAALQETLQVHRAESHRKENAILNAISKLQAIDYDPSTDTKPIDLSEFDTPF